MADVDDDLRATTDSISADAEQLQEIEEHKGDLEPTDPKAKDLSVKAQDLAQRLLNETTAERQLTEEASGEADPAPA